MASYTDVVVIRRGILFATQGATHMPTRSLRDYELRRIDRLWDALVSTRLLLCSTQRLDCVELFAKLRALGAQSREPPRIALLLLLALALTSFFFGALLFGFLLGRALPLIFAQRGFSETLKFFNASAQRAHRDKLVGVSNFRHDGRIEHEAQGLEMQSLYNYTRSAHVRLLTPTQIKGFRALFAKKPEQS